MDIPAGHKWTKEFREERFGKVAGGSGSSAPEKYQLEKLSILGKITKTTTRINLTTGEFVKGTSSFENSENFDGFIQLGGKKVWINLKSIVGSGGSQLRSLREVFWFIRGQIKAPNDLYLNILDGDFAAKNMGKLREGNQKRNIYIGDLKGAT